MKKIIAFAGSNSSTSINRQLVLFASKKVKAGSVIPIELSAFDVELYSEDLEKESGIPSRIWQLHQLFSMADGFLISIPEHNGILPAFFKNIIDWLSRIDRNIFNGKPVMLLATSPGQYGGRYNLNIMRELFPKWGAQLSSTYSLGNFHDHFDLEKGAMISEDHESSLDEAISDFNEAIYKAAPEIIYS